MEQDFTLQLKAQHDKMVQKYQQKQKQADALKLQQFFSYLKLKQLNPGGTYFSKVFDEETRKSFDNLLSTRIRGKQRRSVFFTREGKNHRGEFDLATVISKTIQQYSNKKVTQKSIQVGQTLGDSLEVFGTKEQIVAILQAFGETVPEYAESQTSLAYKIVGRQTKIDANALTTNLTFTAQSTPAAQEITRILASSTFQLKNYLGKDTVINLYDKTTKTSIPKMIKAMKNIHLGETKTLTVLASIAEGDRVQYINQMITSHEDNNINEIIDLHYYHLVQLYELAGEGQAQNVDFIIYNDWNGPSIIVKDVGSMALQILKQTTNIPSGLRFNKKNYTVTNRRFSSVSTSTKIKF